MYVNVVRKAYKPGIIKALGYQLIIMKGGEMPVMAYMPSFAYEGAQ